MRTAAGEEGRMAYRRPWIGEIDASIRSRRLKLGLRVRVWVIERVSREPRRSTTTTTTGSFSFCCFFRFPPCLFFPLKVIY